jgi:hypothetical protein
MDKPNKDLTKYSIFFNSKLLFQTVTKTKIVIKQLFLYETITFRVNCSMPPDMPKENQT